MSSEVITCTDCGRNFIWTYSEQRYYRERNLSAPKRCPECRSRRRFEQAMGSNEPIGTQTLGGSAAQTAPTAVPSTGAGSAPSSGRDRPAALSWWANVHYRFAAITFGLALLVALVMKWAAPTLDIILCWLFAVTVVTFLSYGYDKMISGTEQTRVPEKVLLALTLAGGTLGALGATRYFHHKTMKAEFQSKLWLVITVQVILLVLWFVGIKPILQRP